MIILVVFGVIFGLAVNMPHETISCTHEVNLEKGYDYKNCEVKR